MVIWAVVFLFGSYHRCLFVAILFFFPKKKRCLHVYNNRLFTSLLLPCSWPLPFAHQQTIFFSLSIFLLSYLVCYLLARLVFHSLSIHLSFISVNHFSCTYAWALPPSIIIRQYRFSVYFFFIVKYCATTFWPVAKFCAIVILFWHLLIFFLLNHFGPVVDGYFPLGILNNSKLQHSIDIEKRSEKILSCRCNLAFHAIRPSTEMKFLFPLVVCEQIHE